MYTHKDPLRFGRSSFLTLPDCLVNKEPSFKLKL